MRVKEITIEEYNKKMKAIIKKGLPVWETLSMMLEKASRYKIKITTKNKKEKI
jgi:hypothetical protein